MIYDPVSQRCSPSSAGHPGPVVTRPDGTSSIRRPEEPNRRVTPYGVLRGRRTA
ncbi:hypothetical protein [Streptomyces sp. NPDC052721]|uniref:hypothetical protein n=1 Tax=Streptomyces sp. NPDC052721 TaxID=3154955 RepID=UPI0034391A11